jgi:ankyrin repeat protein
MAVAICCPRCNRAHGDDSVFCRECSVKLFSKDNIFAILGEHGFPGAHFHLQNESIYNKQISIDYEDIPDHFWEPLHWAAHEGQREIAEMLLASGADPCQRTATGETPLHLCASLAVAGALLKAGAAPEARNIRGETPVFMMVRQNRIEVLRLLIARGASVQSRNNYGLTPLHRAVKEGSCEIAELLIENGAQVNAINDEGCTPLHFADSREMAALLLKRGAQINPRDNNGWTPLTKARIVERTLKNNADIKELIDLLRRFGAQE